MERHKIMLLAQLTETENVRYDLYRTITERVIAYNPNITAFQQFPRLLCGLVVSHRTLRQHLTVHRRKLIQRARLLPEYRSNY